MHPRAGTAAPRRRRHGAQFALGRALHSRTQPDAAGGAATAGAVRHCAGRRPCGFAQAERRRHRSPGLRRLRTWRAGAGRSAGTARGASGRVSGAIARRRAALFDGTRPPRMPGGGHRRRRGFIRLRGADAPRAPRADIHQPGPAAAAQRALPGRLRAAGPALRLPRLLALQPRLFAAPVSGERAPRPAPRQSSQFAFLSAAHAARPRGNFRGQLPGAAQ